MKKLLWTVLLSAALNLSAPGALYTSAYDSGFQNGGIIPDGNANGWTDTRTVSGVSGIIQDVNVYVNVSGGANGDLYAYLSFKNGSVVLLNRVGTTSSNPFGSSAAGFGSGPTRYNFKLDDAGATDIHAYNSGDPVTGVYQPDRRTADPLVVLDTSTRGSSLASFNNLSPNGDWTLFFADTVGGNSPSTVVSWGLEITAVPEPVNTALGIFGGVFVVVLISKNQRMRKRIHRWRDGVVEWVDAV